MTRKKEVVKQQNVNIRTNSCQSTIERLVMMLEMFKEKNAVGMTVKQIHEQLGEKGVKTTVRSIQRLMVELEVAKLFQRFPLANGKALEALWTLTPYAVRFLGMPRTPAYLNIIHCKNQAGPAGMTIGEAHEHVSKT